MRNIIRPAVDDLLYTDVDDSMRGAMEYLIDTFYKEVRAGNTKINNIKDFIQLSRLMLELKGEIQPENTSTVVMANADPEEIDKIYQRMFKTINDAHDELNNGE